MVPYFTCGCDPLCDFCVEEKFSQLSGVVQSRGETWARNIAKVIPMTRPWPHTERTRAIALRKVSDLTTDERLRSKLATEVEIGACRWWNRAREQAG
jgi:hypothetical protein